MTDPFSHPWLGGLFGDPEVEAIWSAERQLAHMIAFEAAYARALGTAGTVAPDSAERAACAIEAVGLAPSDLRDGTARDGVPVPALVRLLRGAAGEDADAVHTGATSQDAVDTALALTLREAADLSSARLDALDSALGGLEHRFGTTTIMGRTRMQAAMPIAADVRIGAWRRPLACHRDRLAASRARVERLQLGGAAGDRAALGAHGSEVARHVAGALGLADGPPWHAERDGVLEHGQVMAGIAGTLGKLGQDVCLMAQQGVDEVALRGGGGSSAMPHKANPVDAELLVALARHAAGQTGLLAQAMIHEQERSGAAWMLEWLTLPPLSHAALQALAVAHDLVAGIDRIGAS